MAKDKATTEEIDKSKIDKDQSVEKDTKVEDAKKLTRESYIKTLQDLGIATDNLSDEELLFKVIAEFNNTNKKLVNATAEKELTGIKKYTIGVEHKIEDEKFIARLFNLSVPNFYLHLFTDKDVDLVDADIWARINKSNINPFKSIKDIVESQFKYS